ncbi:hypothetical protein [Rhizobium sp. RAF56]|uniref:hypothetical protein n=1 Tax=Rhizobium sp. RAF56 TaxID=3233062 RepID=UPI003F9B0E31
MSRSTSVTADVLGSLATLTPDASLAQALAANAEVEGKLNILLLAARERMFDSLAAVINALSQTFNLPRDADETSSAYALRLADAITRLTEPQLAQLEQKLAGKVPMPPLPIVAAAMQDPAGEAAAQIVAYLEVVRYRERDLATRAVVNSYGLNAGASELQDAMRPTPQLPARMIAQAAPSPQTPTLASRASPPEVPAAAKAMALLAADASVAAAAPAGGLPPDPAVAMAGKGAGPRPDTATKPFAQPSSTDTVDPAGAGAELAAALENVDDPSAPSAVVSDRLKSVVQRAIASVGPELLDIMADHDHMVETVMAQALVADMLDDQDMAKRPQDGGSAKAPDRLQTASLPADRVEAGEEPAARLFASAALTGAALAAEPPALPQAPNVALGVPFAVAQYLPREDDETDEPVIAIDRVDPVDDEGGSRQQQASDEDEQDQAPEESGGDEAGEDASIPAPSGLTRAFGIYQRLVGRK